MLRPVGSLPPEVYWRRRLFLLVSLLLVLLVLIVGWALVGGVFFSGRGGAAGAAGARSTTGPPASPTGASAPAAAGASRSAGPRSGGTHRSGAAGGSTRTAKAAGRRCQPQDLVVQALTSAKSYPVNSRPTLLVQVTDIGPRRCRQDLADKQIELQITSGGVRVWGSHDCVIAPGVDPTTLLPQHPVQRGVVWSGLTSAKGCAGTRLVAQAGTYELTATLGRQLSYPVSFRLTGTG